MSPPRLASVPSTAAARGAFRCRPLGAALTSEKEQQQPSTTVFLKEDFSSKDNAERLANFCTGLRMNEIVKRVDYIPEKPKFTSPSNYTRPCSAWT